MISHIGFPHQRVQNPDVRANIAIYSNSELRYCGRNLRKRKQSDAEFAGNSLLRMAIIDIVINTLLGRVTRHPAGIYCPAWDDAFVSSFFFKARLDESSPLYVY